MRRSLNWQLVLDSAIRIADEAGIENLSMRGLASELGVKPAALYNYVSSKEALLDGMIATVIKELESSTSPGDAWDDKIRERLSNFRAVAHRHPNLYGLFAQRFTTHIPQVLLLVEDVLEALKEGGFEVPIALHGYRTLMNYTIGYAMAEIRGFSLEEDPTELPPPFRSRRPLPADFPRVIELAPYLKNVDHDEEFMFGIDCILAGLKVEPRPH